MGPRKTNSRRLSPVSGNVGSCIRGSDDRRLLPESTGLGVELTKDLLRGDHLLTFFSKLTYDPGRRVGCPPCYSSVGSMG